MERKNLKDVCLTFWLSFICSVGCILSQLLCSVKQEVLLDQLFTSCKMVYRHKLFFLWCL